MILTAIPIGSYDRYRFGRSPEPKPPHFCQHIFGCQPMGRAHRLFADRPQLSLQGTVMPGRPLFQSGHDVIEGSLDG